jgi:hypothetical protein
MSDGSDVADTTAAQIATLDPAVAAFVAELVSACRAAGWPVVILPLGARRSRAQQDELVRQRLSKNPDSRHLYGLAFDLDLSGYARAEGMPLWRFLGAWWEGAGLKWGGSFGDYGHFEW